MFLAKVSPSCRLASAQVGSLPLSIMTACNTISTNAGGLPYDLISVMSFLFRASNAWEKNSNRKCQTESEKISIIWQIKSSRFSVSFRVINRKKTFLMDSNPSPSWRVVTSTIWWSHLVNFDIQTTISLMRNWMALHRQTTFLASSSAGRASSRSRCALSAICLHLTSSADMRSLWAATDFCCSSASRFCWTMTTRYSSHCFWNWATCKGLKLWRLHRENEWGQRQQLARQEKVLRCKINFVQTSSTDSDRSKYWIMLVVTALSQSTNLGLRDFELDGHSFNFSSGVVDFKQTISQLWHLISQLFTLFKQQAAQKLLLSVSSFL